MYDMTNPADIPESVAPETAPAHTTLSKPHLRRSGMARIVGFWQGVLAG
jgi:hypothetical protein